MVAWFVPDLDVRRDAAKARTEIARALFGLDKHTGGTVRLMGKRVSFSSPTEAIAHGVGLVPENRKADGLFFNFEGPPNITSSRLRALLRGLFLDPAKERRAGQEYIQRLRITPAAVEKSVQYLSGGNQQKVVIARWLFSQARLLILDEPTQGIDVGAKLDVYDVINTLTAQGISILLISSDYPELLAMSDRVAVVRDGRILHVAEAGQLAPQPAHGPGALHVAAREECRADHVPSSFAVGLWHRTPPFRTLFV